ncbi:hypothetical protein VE03_05853 [Pseudogymnoascus sp. 23342-1-I1]|nr:hypothetical protein VE03_05853 [Pseudogymnoascus sp. 23342-1-I1]
MTTHNAYPLQLLPTTSTHSLKSTLKPSSLKNPFDTASILTTSTRYSQSPPPYTPFHATSSLQIQSSGLALLAFPNPPKQLTTAVFSLSSSGHCERPVYLSTRAERSSGNCTLVRGEDESAAPLAETTYRWGPSAPVVRVGGEEMVMEKRKWVSRTVSFVWGGGRYEWRYGGRSEKRAVEAERGEECHCLILLERVEGEKKGEVRTTVARFVRGVETRTPGTKRSTAGNGGRLEMGLGGEGEGIREEVVVATVLVMLKKEVDCQRGTQIAIIGMFLAGSFCWMTGGPISVPSPGV